MIFRAAALLRSDFVGNRRVNQGKSADSAEIHQDDQNKLKNTELRCDPKGKPDRSDSGRRFVKAGAKRQTFCRADNNAADKNSRKYITATVAAFSLPNRQCACHRLRHRPFLRQTENALRIRTAKRSRFHTACRGAGRSADEHQQNHNCLRGTGHSGKIGGIETGGSRCDRLKSDARILSASGSPCKIAEEKNTAGAIMRDCRCYQYDLTLHTVFFEMPLVCVNIVPGQKSIPPTIIKSIIAMFIVGSPMYP